MLAIGRHIAETHAILIADWIQQATVRRPANSPDLEHVGEIRSERHLSNGYDRL